MSLRAFVPLTFEAVRDGLRSRAGLGVALAGILCLMIVHRCTGLEVVASGFDGREIDPTAMTRMLGPVLYGMVALFLVAAVGLVAADGLARPIEEGSVSLWLARPVSRSTYALARLAGALLLGGGTGVVVLLAATGLLNLRHGLALGPGALGAAIFFFEAIVVAGIAMAASLVLPRLVTLFLVVLWIQLVVFANTAHMLGARPGGWLGTMEQMGPPLGTALLFAVSPWVGVETNFEQAAWVFGRLGAWAIASALLVVVAFRRIELR